MSLPGSEFRASFDQLIEVSAGFFWILLPFFVYLFSPRKSVSPRAGDLEVRDAVVQGGGMELCMFIGERALMRLRAFGLLFFLLVCVCMCVFVRAPKGTEAHTPFSRKM